MAAWLENYKGGQTSPIWIARLSDSSVEEIPRKNSNDKYPVWLGDKIYFLSDRSGPVSLFEFDTKSKQVKQLIRNDGLDFKFVPATRSYCLRAVRNHLCL
jgi:tricorn protease